MSGTGAGWARPFTCRHPCDEGRYVAGRVAVGEDERDLSCGSLRGKRLDASKAAGGGALRGLGVSLVPRVVSETRGTLSMRVSSRRRE